MKKENINYEVKLESLKEDVYDLLKNDNSGHDKNHIERVLNLALKFNKEAGGDKNIITLIALLHDVSDYKLVEKVESENLTNVKYLLNKYEFSNTIKQQVLKEISKIGYSKRLNKIMPQTLEGKLVSDADMCDAMGANGILRCYDYNKSKNIPFFVKDIFPTLNLDFKTYKEKPNISSVNHFFEKLLRLENLMLTKEGIKEAKKRSKIMIDFLKNYFLELDSYDWLEYLENYLKKEN